MESAATRYAHEITRTTFLQEFSWSRKRDWHESRRKRMKKRGKEIVNNVCGDCVRGEVYLEFSTLSLKGMPTIKKCPYFEYKRLLSEKACDKFKKF